LDPQKNQSTNELSPTSSYRASVRIDLLDGYICAANEQDGI